MTQQATLIQDFDFLLVTLKQFLNIIINASSHNLEVHHHGQLDESRMKTRDKIMTEK